MSLFLYNQSLKYTDRKLGGIKKIEYVEGDPLDPEEGVLYVVAESTGIPVKDYFFRFDASALELNDNDKVSVWQDLSGNGFDLTQTDADRQPTFLATGLNGMPTVQFADSLLVNESFQLDNNTEFTVFMVTEVDDNTNSSTFFTIVERAALSYAVIMRFSGNDQDVIFDINGSRSAYAPLITTNPVLYTATYDPSVMRIYTNGSFIRQNGHSGALVTHDTLTLGGRPAVSRIPYFGRISELIYFTRVLNAVEQNAMNTYLMDKWGF